MTKTIRNLIAALLLIGASHGAMASFQSGSSSLTWCESENSQEKSHCFGYLAAVADTADTLAGWEGFEPSICVPLGVTGGQLIKVWVKYANEHPEELHLSASSLVLSAYAEAFPCD